MLVGESYQRSDQKLTAAEGRGFLPPSLRALPARPSKPAATRRSALAMPFLSYFAPPQLQLPGQVPGERPACGAMARRASGPQ
ncbi:MAG: hypothetical protein WKG07_06065 [Hymenobacter sp.]